MHCLRGTIWWQRGRPHCWGGRATGVFVVIRYAGAAYLLYLAWKLWTAPPRSLQAPPEMNERGGLFLTGLAINLGNPRPSPSSWR